MFRKKDSQVGDKPLHVAITMDGDAVWAERNKTDLKKAFKVKFEKLKELMLLQITEELPILTFYMLTQNQEQEEDYHLEIAEFFEELSSSDYIHDNRIKVSVIGKWYNLPSNVVDAIKKIINQTKEYDNYFLNFCVKYNGQDEIVDACKLLVRQVQAGKMQPELITKEVMKDNLYSSYFLAPNVIVKTGKKKNTGLLLWDSVYAKTLYAGKTFHELKKQDFLGFLK